MLSSEQLEQRIQTAIGTESNPNQAFFSWAELLSEQLAFPLTAVWWDETFTITGINLIESSHSHGFKMTAQNLLHALPYHELIFDSLMPDNAAWLAAFNYWQEVNL